MSDGKLAPLFKPFERLPLRGGWRQRLFRIRHGILPHRANRNTSENAVQNLNLWSLGKLSSAGLRRQMRSNMNDQGKDASAVCIRLGKLGGRTAKPNGKLHCDLMRLLMKCNLESMLTTSPYNTEKMCLLPSTIMSVVFAASKRSF